MRDKKVIGLLAAALLMSMVVVAQELALTPDAPTRYIVKKGDTLWDISTVFLVEPWRWPEIWEANPQVANPHLIYPGDELALFYRDGRPVIELRRRAEAVPEGVPPEGVGPAVIRRPIGPRTVKLSPGARVLSREDAIPTIPIDAIHQFLARPRVLGPGEFDAAPYIVSLGPEAMVGFTGKPVFVRGLRDDHGASFGVYRRGQVYQDPQTSETLGYEALHVGDVILQESGDPATLMLTNTTREVLQGDRLLAAHDEQVVANFIPRAPDWDVEGQIIAVMDGVTQIGENQIVVLDLGTRDGVQQGHVMAVYQLGETIVDPISVSQNERVKLPDQRAGAVMVFRPFDRVSYALVMEATRAMHVFDIVKNP